tara:strand:- start:21705 stop:22487 length:783 start_codon:yes stop_codon:yes gene_type:complete
MGMANGEIAIAAFRRERGIDRLLALLARLHEHGRPMRVVELAKALDAPRSTIYELVGALTDAGLLEFSGDGKQVFFGKLTYLYGASYLRENDLIRRGAAEVDRLSVASGETCELCVLHNDRQAIIHMHAGARPQRISSEVGAQIPLPWTASGRLLLSQSSAQEIEALIAPDDLVLPDGRTLPLAAFIDECHAARGAPIIVTKGLINSLTQCLAAPVWGADRKLAATICMVLPIDVPEDQVAVWQAELIASARTLSLDAWD